MAITPLPTPVPNRGMSEEDFATAGDNLLGALPTWTTEVNALAVDVTNKQATATAAANTATTKAMEANTSATTAADWAIKTTGTVNGSGDYSAKEYAIGTTVPAGSAKEWATTTGSTVDGVEYSAKKYALDSLSYKNSAEAAAAAAQSAAGLPSLTGNAGKSLLVNSTASGVEWGFPESVPAGTVIAFAGNTPPSGYLKANGAAISRTVYAALFAAIGTTYGAGNGSTTFNLPDLRGEFLRGWDDGRGVDSGRALGSFQSQSVESHVHSVTASTSGGSGSSNSGANYSSIQTFNTGAYGGNETRPRNVALLYCIKY